MLRSSYSDARHQQAMWVTNNTGYDAQDRGLQPGARRGARGAGRRPRQPGQGGPPGACWGASVLLALEWGKTALSSWSQRRPFSPGPAPFAPRASRPAPRPCNQQETLTLRDRYLVDLGAEFAGRVRRDPARLLPYSVRRFLRCIVSLSCFESINAPPRRKRT